MKLTTASADRLSSSFFLYVLFPLFVLFGVPGVTIQLQVFYLLYLSAICLLFDPGKIDMKPLVYFFLNVYFLCVLPM